MTSALFLAAFAGLLQLCASLQLVPLPSRATTVAISSSRAAPTYMMAGFGGGGAAKPAKKGSKGGKKAATKKSSDMSPKRQWDVFKELVSSGSPRVPVFAKLPDDDKWSEVGEVAVKAPGTPAQAVQFQKRLILEHAPRVNPALQNRARELIAGLAADADSEPEALGKQELPEGLNCGFEGGPDASGKYSKVRGTTRNSDPTAIVGSTAR